MQRVPGAAASRSSLVLGALALVALAAAPARADKCTAAKLKAIGKKEAGLLGCQAKVVATNDPSGLAACEMKVSAKFSAALTKAGSCIGDAITCEAIADDCEAKVRAILSDPGPDTCESARLKAAGKLASDLLGCYAKAAAKDLSLFGIRSTYYTCYPKSLSKFQAAFLKVAGCTGDAPGYDNLLLNALRACLYDAATFDADGKIIDDICSMRCASTRIEVGPGNCVRVVSNPPGIDCSPLNAGGTGCSDGTYFNTSSPVQLTAQAPGAAFARDCDPAGNVQLQNAQPQTGCYVSCVCSAP